MTSFRSVSIAEIEAALAAPPRGPAGDDGVAHAEARRPAAVLMPVTRTEAGLNMLLTQRPDTMREHAGQVAFPGGKVDSGDASPLAAALRETWEEVGIPADKLRVLGRIETYRTGTGFLITPFVALVEPGVAPVAEPGEVDEIFAPPLDFLMNPAHHQRHSREWRGMRRRYWAIPWEGRFIWGATAGMLRQLAERIGAARSS